MKPLVLGLGTAAMDVVLECDDLPREDGFAFVQRERLVPGGSCANVLTALVRLGSSAGLVARMGDDAYGRAFVADLERSGVSAAHVDVRPGGTSLHTFIAVGQGGAKSILAHMGDSLLALSEERVSEAMVDGIQVFYTDMLPGGPALKLARICRERGVPVVFNLEVGPGFHALCGTSLKDLDEMISLSYLFLTYGEALAELTGRDDPDEALDALVRENDLPGGAVATLGTGGAVWRHAAGNLALPAFPVEARDTTGAGDAFAAGLIQSCLLEGAPQAEALAFASACAALKCTQPGPRFTGNRGAVIDFLKRRDAGTKTEEEKA